MRTRPDASRLLGATFLVVVLTSLVSGVLLSSAVGSGSYSNRLTHLADNVALLVKGARSVEAASPTPPLTSSRHATAGGIR